MDETTASPLGRHILAEFYDCDPVALDGADSIRAVMEKAAEMAGATVISSHFHAFSPQGVSGVVIIAESHITIHTWPEKRYAAVDIFTCGVKIQPDRAVAYLKENLRCGHVSIVEMKRGYV
jgi:S-adenosylmethionine decarboxylase